MSKMESVKRMLSKAFLQKLKVDYVLMDSWFTCFDLLRTVQSLWQGKLHVIGRCKMDQTLYEVDGKKWNAQELRLFELYQIRWNIGVVWKECKQYLELGKYQGRDLDGQIADCALVFITHTILCETLVSLFWEPFVIQTWLF